MLTVGLTGGIGAGKSSVATELRTLGAVVVDADQIAREVVAPGTEGLEAIRSAFGPSVISAEGELDRPAMAAQVFGDAAARERLEGITHPLIARRAAELFAQAEREHGPELVAVYDMPLLIEKRMGAEYHLVIVVDAPVADRVERLVATRGMDPSDVRARIAAQASTEDRRRAADIWLENATSPEDLAEQVREVWRERLVPFATNLAAGRPASSSAHAASAARSEVAARVQARLRRALGGRPADVRRLAPEADEVSEDPIRLQVSLDRAEPPDLTAAGLVVVDATEPVHYRSADPGQAVEVSVHTTR